MEFLGKHDLLVVFNLCLVFCFYILIVKIP